MTQISAEVGGTFTALIWTDGGGRVRSSGKSIISAGPGAYSSAGRPPSSPGSL